MSQDWNFGPTDPTAYDPDQPPPTPKRFRKVLQREQRTRDQLHPAAPPGEAAEPPAGRDAHGRFTKGNKGGTGNPFARQTAALRQALVNAVTEDDMAEVAATVIAKAKAGDMAAAKLLFSYVLGKPTEMPNPDRLELDDYQLLKERLSPLREDWDLIRAMIPVEGIVEAGHTVADLRAANWREQVLGPERPSEPVPAGSPKQALEDLSPAEMRTLLREMSALAREEADEAAPSANGSDGHDAPSANGLNEQPAPSANGSNGPETVLPRHTGKTEEDRIYARQARMLPSANGAHGVPAPSANGGTARVDGRQHQAGRRPEHAAEAERGRKEVGPHVETSDSAGANSTNSVRSSVIE